MNRENIEGKKKLQNTRLKSKMNNKDNEMILFIAMLTFNYFIIRVFYKANYKYLANVDYFV